MAGLFLEYKSFFNDIKIINLNLWILRRGKIESRCFSQNELSVAKQEFIMFLVDEYNDHSDLSVCKGHRVDCYNPRNAWS